MRLEPGHNVYLLAVTIPSGLTSRELETLVVGWLGDALDVEVSRRTEAGEYVIGPANPVTVIPMLDATLDAARGGFCTGPENRRDVISTSLPSAGAVPVKLHVDWLGAPTALPDFWLNGFLAWRPDADQPDLIVQAQCSNEQTARPPTEEPPFLDVPSLPELPDTSKVVGGSLLLIAAAVGVAVLYAKAKG